MDGGAWQATVHSVTKSQTQLSDYHSLKLATICCHSPRSICLLHRPNRHVERGYCGNCHLCTFQVIDGGTNLCYPSPGLYCFYFTILVGDELFQKLPLDLPYYDSFHQQAQCMDYSNCHIHQSQDIFGDQRNEYQVNSQTWWT